MTYEDRTARRATGPFVQGEIWWLWRAVQRPKAAGPWRTLPRSRWQEYRPLLTERAYLVRGIPLRAGIKLVRGVLTRGWVGPRRPRGRGLRRAARPRGVSPVRATDAARPALNVL